MLCISAVRCFDQESFRRISCRSGVTHFDLRPRPRIELSGLKFAERMRKRFGPKSFLTAVVLVGQIGRFSFDPQLQVGRFWMLKVGWAQVVRLLRKA